MVKAFDELYAGLTSGTDVVVKSESRLRRGRRHHRRPGPPARREHRRDGACGPGRRGRARGRSPGFALILDKHGEPDPARRRPDVRHERQRRPSARRRGHLPRGPRTRRAPTRWRSTRAPRRRPGYQRRRPRSTSCSRTAGGPSPWSASSGFGETDSLLGATLAGFDLPTAQQVLGKVGRGRRGRRHGRGRRRAPASCATGSPRCCPTASRR